MRFAFTSSVAGLAAIGGVAASLASGSPATPAPPVSLTAVKAAVPALANGARISALDPAVQASPIEPVGDPVVDVATLRRPAAPGPEVVVASTLDGNGTCIGADALLSCAPLSALKDLGAVYGISRTPDKTQLAALLLNPTGSVDVVFPDGSTKTLTAVDGVISAELDGSPASLVFTKPDGTKQTIQSSIPGQG